MTPDKRVEEIEKAYNPCIRGSGFGCACKKCEELIINLIEDYDTR